MALRAIMLKKKIDDKSKELQVLREKSEEHEKREAELAQSIEEATTDEEKEAVERAIEDFEQEKRDNGDAQAKLEAEVEQLEGELKEIEGADTDGADAPAESTEGEERKMSVDVMTRSLDTYGRKIRDRFEALNMQERTALFERDDVHAWIDEIRSHIKEKRELTNVGLTIPEVFIGYLRENITVYSKLYRHANVVRINGTGREVIMGSVPEAVWTECCGVLNELSLNFNDAEVNCFKVGGFFKVCNAILEDSDLNLSAEILDAIAQAIGLALDKAILYGRNTSSNYKMPLGVVSRLVQTGKPSDYPATARTWVDLHSTNVISIAASKTGLDLYKELTKASGVAKGKYARGEKVWVMNETTYTALKVEAMSINAAGAIVSGIDGRMPIIGGIIEVLDFIPNNVIIGGYFELYLLAERAGSKFAQSEHAFFIQDQTVFKGTARYDGQPVIAEAFIAIGINGTTPTSTMTFAADSANTGA